MDDSWMGTEEVQARICRVGGFRNHTLPPARRGLPPAPGRESIDSLTPLLYHNPYNIGSLLLAHIRGAPGTLVDIILTYLVEELDVQDMWLAFPGMPLPHRHASADWWIFYL